MKELLHNIRSLKTGILTTAPTPLRDPRAPYRTTATAAFAPKPCPISTAWDAYTIKQTLLSSFQAQKKEKPHKKVKTHKKKQRKLPQRREVSGLGVTERHNNILQIKDTTGLTTYKRHRRVEGSPSSVIKVKRFT